MKSVAPVKLSAAEIKGAQTGRVGAPNAPCETSPRFQILNQRFVLMSAGLNKELGRRAAESKVLTTLSAEQLFQTGCRRLDLFFKTVFPASLGGPTAKTGGRSHVSLAVHANGWRWGVNKYLLQRCAVL